MDTFAEYLSHIEDPRQRRRTEDVLAWVLQQFPKLVPRIAWSQPVFTDHGTYIIGFSVARKHLAVAPERVALDHFSEEIKKSGYGMSKELMRIPWDNPVDYELLKKMIAFNLTDKAEVKTFWRKQK